METRSVALACHAVCAAAPPLATVWRLAADFRRLFAARDATAVGPWLAAAQQSELRGLAASLWRDRAAVEAAVALP